MEHIISLDNIKKSYYLSSWEEIPVLKGIHLDVKKGSSVALMGPSWSGKSTLLNIIWFLHPTTSGKYFFNGEDIADFKDDKTLSFIRNMKCWFVFQQYYLIPRLTSLQNVMLPGLYAGTPIKERIDRAKHLLNEVGLWDKLENKPAELSGWQQQRVAIARSLMNNPELILADEPTWALDSENSEEVITLLMSLQKEGTSIIMVTHEEHIATYADRIVRLKDGIITNSLE